MSLLRRREMMQEDKSIIYFDTECENGTFEVSLGEETTSGYNNRARTMDKIMLNAGKYLLNAEGIERGSVFMWDEHGEFIGYYPSAQTELPFEFTISEKRLIRCVFSHLNNSIVNPNVIKNIIFKKI